MSQVAKYETSDGRAIYTFPVEAFPTLIANIYLIDDGNDLTLVDCASGFERANRQLLEGFGALQQKYGSHLSLDAIERIVITHAHIDHFGGLPFVRQHTQAPTFAHILDRRVLSAYEERIVLASRRLETFLERAGVPSERRQTLMSMYLFAKGVYHSTPVDFLLDEAHEPWPGVRVIHVPGHCPGQVCLQLDDILLTADHVLSHTTPHQAPESITLNMGLGHYLQSLDKVAALDNVRLALGGHEEPMTGLRTRITQIKDLHQQRLQRILDICHEPLTIAGISRRLFGDVSSYHVLLALEETGAHVEYLYQRGELFAANLEEVETARNAPICYQRT